MPINTTADTITLSGLKRKIKDKTDMAPTIANKTMLITPMAAAAFNKLGPPNQPNNANEPAMATISNTNDDVMMSVSTGFCLFVTTRMTPIAAAINRRQTDSTPIAAAAFANDPFDMRPAKATPIIKTQRRPMTMPALVKPSWYCSQGIKAYRPIVAAKDLRTIPNANNNAAPFNPSFEATPTSDPIIPSKNIMMPTVNAPRISWSSGIAPSRSMDLATMRSANPMPVRPARVLTAPCPVLSNLPINNMRAL